MESTKPKYSVEKVYENIEITKGIFRLTVKGEFIANPGQFYLLRCWEGEPILSRPISIHNMDSEKITFLYQTKGQGVELLSKLKPEDEIQLTGPLGNGFDVDNIRGKVAIVSGGIGIAPMLYVLKSLKECTVDFYAGFRDEVYVLEELEGKANNIFVSTENGKAGHKGYITEIFNPKRYDLVLCCGPEIMMKKVVEMCNKSNIPIYVSMEKHMACGIGACLVCTCKTKEGNKRTCKDGPVFTGEDILF
jgi:dihydroorotate dehydrogenase electron transfer subunit